MRRILAVLLLAAVVLGAPAVLVVAGFYDWGAIDLVVAGDIRMLLAALTVVAWAAWGLWMVLLVSELVALLTQGRIRVRLPGLAWPQLVAGAVLAAALSSGLPHVARAQTPEPTIAVVLADSEPDQKPEEEPGETPPVSPSEEAPAVEKMDGPGHMVVEGDDLWSLAEDYYDDGREWRRIVDANPDLADDPTSELPAGTWLSVPGQVKLVTVVRGDTLSGLALKHLGDGNRWPEIYDLNRSRVADPDLIDIGWVLKIPRIEAANPHRAEQVSEVEVSEAETVAEESLVGVPSEPVAEVELDAVDVSTDESALEQGELVALEEGVDPVCASTEGQHRPGVTPPPSRAAVEDQGEAAPTVEVSTVVESVSTMEPEAVGALVGGVSSLTASMVLGSVALHRSLRDRVRPAGRRYAHPTSALQRVETALATRQAPGRETLIDRALRVLGAHWFAEGAAAPGVEQVLVTGSALEFRFDGETTLPPGFTQLGDTAVVGWGTLSALPETDHPAAYPGLVTVGADANGDLVMADLVGAGVLGVRARSAELARESLSAMLIELTCAPWADEIELLVVTGDDEFVRVAGGPAALTTDDAGAAVDRVERWVAERRRRLNGGRFDELRLDPELADAWRSRVALFESPLPEDLVRRLEAAIGGASLGVAATLPVGVEAGEARWKLSASGRRTREAFGRVETPNTVSEETRESITELIGTVADTATSPAPWWVGQEEDVKIIELHPLRAGEGPLLRMLGPIDLVDAAGDPPERAARQCLEYCAWIMANPGSTAVEMGASLLVADSTRRSNMSRLRAWLGHDTEGNPYLPDAYSGRIHLADSVSSDWEQFRALIAAGVVRTPPDRLRLALELVRGAPLADAAPSQWGWAEEMRSDMVATIRDVALVLSRHALAERDWELARWAANRGLVAAPEDELLLCERIRVEHAQGYIDEVTRLVVRLTRSASALGVDLLPETVALCQEVMEGRVRARRA